MVQIHENTCPRCDSLRMKTWDELTPDERFLAERLPMSADYTHDERKKHRFCVRCWYELINDGIVEA
jgi:ribosomal protein S27AE